ncbi:MAG: hypothetical protein ACOCWC_05330 [Bacteroidota bacterium]
MKKIKIYSLLLFVLVFIASACSKDDETKINNWIIGTWSIDKYEQLDFEDGVLVSESESVNQGEVRFYEDGTGYDIGGNFIGEEFEWSNTDTYLILKSGGGTTTYDIESFSETNFAFSITDRNGDDWDVERWYLSK